MEIITHQMATIPWLEGHALALEIAWLTGGCLSLLASLGMVIFMVVQLDWRAKHSIIKNFSSLLLFQLAVSNALSALFYLISLWKAQSDGA
jgi:Zn-dependent protease